MSGRIRTIKPEWMEDELLASTSSEARLLSVALVLMADDYGNGRASVASIAGEAFRYQMAANDGVDAHKVMQTVRLAIGELEAARFITLYDVEGQRYFAIRNWTKHQKVDKPGKPRVPGPTAVVKAKPAESPKVAYFVRGALTGLIKIGESIDPVARLVDLAKAGSERLDLLAVGGIEAEHHKALADDRVHGEWFKASSAVLAKIREYGGDPETPIASAGYDGSARVLKITPANVPEEVANLPDVVATDPDLDLRSGSPIPDREPIPAVNAREVIEDPPDRKIRGALVRGYGERYQNRTRDFWQGASKAASHIDEVARWCAKYPDPMAQVERVLDGAFADPWMNQDGRRWPWGSIASDPAKVAAGPIKPTAKVGRFEDTTPLAGTKPGVREAEARALSLATEQARREQVAPPPSFADLLKLKSVPG